MIKNIIFDFGNVLLDLELGNLESGFRTLYGADFESVQKKLRGDHVFELFETGGLSAAEFLAILSGAGGKSLKPEAVLEVWNSIFKTMPAERFDMLLQLRQRYRVFLLSNINALHEAWITNYFRITYNIVNFEARYFDGVYYSHLIRLRKPDRCMYEYVLADAELLPEESLFIDDLPENLAAAAEMGIRTRHHPPGSDILQAMVPYLR